MPNIILPQPSLTRRRTTAPTAPGRWSRPRPAGTHALTQSTADAAGSPASTAMHARTVPVRPRPPTHPTSTTSPRRARANAAVIWLAARSPSAGSPSSCHSITSPARSVASVCRDTARTTVPDTCSTRSRMDERAHNGSVRKHNLHPVSLGEDLSGSCAGRESRDGGAFVRKTNVVHHHRQVARSARAGRGRHRRLPRPAWAATHAPAPPDQRQRGQPRRSCPGCKAERDPTGRVPVEPPASLLQPERLPHQGKRLGHANAAVDVNGL